MLIKSSHGNIPSNLIRPDLVGFTPESFSPQGNYIPNPIVIEQTARGERQYDIYSRLLLDRIVFLGTEVNDTVANLLPATSFFLMSDRYAPARKLIDSGAIVSLSTDCNPGSSMTESMQIVMQLATLRMKMTVEESLTAATLNGAYSLRLSSETGSIETGKRADLVLLDAPNYLHLVYHFGVNLVRDVFRDGNQVVRDGRLTDAR